MDDALDTLRVLHQQIDDRAEALASQHRARLQCRRGCAACCVDGIEVLEVEAERIRRAHPELLRAGTPHPLGACAFLDAEGACRVYSERPYVCRTQGLPLRWFEAMAGPGAEETPPAERRDICPLNAEGPPIESLPDDTCWLLGPVEAELADLQERFGEARRRVALRALFLRGGASAESADSA